MKDHTEWRAFWFHSELHAFEEMGRAERLHARAILLGSLTGLALAGLVIHYVF